MVEPADSGISHREVIDLDHLIMMANQISDFFAPYPPERAREGLRNHLRTYWDPRMRHALFKHIDAGGTGLEERVIQAAQLLQDQKEEQSGYYGPPKA
ncbi:MULTISPECIES: formate dehydrogenase subunit delta [unclassified Thioalkalivibrio]|uniref:formate dehydrogenase subunit delta n=1 Tax=unclassified Thioalkalivibrio TaxID=2621013 RepID=UPI001E528A0E|nr:MULTISPECIES: formate dehydrogenase subunit delta [unclassified Thioalkalivibrio]